MRRRIRRTGLTILGLVAITLMMAAWPDALGGSTSYLSTLGTSMEPTFRQGDLALIRGVDTYRTGDVVAYHSDVLDTVVMHRIVDIQAGRYVFKGDNNTWLDPDQPDAADLIGKLWLRIPAGGAGLARLRQMLPAAAGMALLARAATTKHRRNRRSQRTTHMPPTESLRRVDGWRAASIGSAACALVAITLTAYAFSRPTDRPADVEIPYTQNAAFSYSAAPVPGPVYNDGLLRTGDPVYLRLIDEIEVAVAYELDASAPATLTGTISLSANITDGASWRHTVDLGPPQHFTGSRVEQRANVNLAQLQALVASVRSTTGISTGTPTVDIVADITGTGTLAGHDLTTSLTPHMAFQLETLQLLPTDLGEDETEPFEITSPATITTTEPVPAAIDVRGLAVPVRQVRSIGLATAAVAALGALLSLRTLRRHRPGPSARIELRHGHRMIPISTAAQGNQLITVDLATIEDLMRLAEQEGSLVLHQRTQHGDRYHFQVDRTVYRYEILQGTAGVAAAS